MRLVNMSDTLFAELAPFMRGVGWPLDFAQAADKCTLEQSGSHTSIVSGQLVDTQMRPLLFNASLAYRPLSREDAVSWSYDDAPPNLLLPSLLFLTDPTSHFHPPYADKSLQLELVLFDDALRHLLRLNRLIEMPRGSALLVGVGGSGKQSLTRLASYISRAVCFQITLTKTYNINSFMEDLR